MANEQARIEIDTSVDQSGLKKGLKEAQGHIKNFAKGAAQEIAGVDQLLSLAAGGGPVALGKAFVQMGQNAVTALNEMAVMWREQEQAEVALANAARNNPYLNEKNVRQLTKFADEMQRVTGLDNVMVLQTQSRLASLGRNQQQIQRILTTAADMAASGVMGFDEAVNELNNSLNGMVRTSGRLYPELKNLSAEALAAGEGIDLIASKVSGSAEAAMQTGAGSVTAYKNAMSDLKKLLGEDWEKAIGGLRDTLTGFINKIVEARNETKELFEIMSDDTVTIETTIEGLSDGQRKRLERIGRDAGNLIGTGINARIGEMNILEATEDSLRTLAESTGLTVEMIRVATLEYGRLDDILRENLILIGERTSAEHAANVAAARAAEEAEALAAAEAAAAAAAALAAEEIIQAREENLRILNEEIELIIEKAKLEGESVRSERVQRQILNARVNAYQNLVKQIGRAGAEEQRVFRELQAEQIRLGMEAANELQAENMKNLERQQRAILEKATLEGRSNAHLEVQRELLDAQVNAYTNQLKIIQDLIDGTAEEDTARRRVLQAQWDQYRLQQRTAYEQKQSLEEMIKLQGELSVKVQRAVADATQSNIEILHERQLREYAAARRGAETPEALRQAIDAEMQYRIEARRRALAQEQSIEESAILQTERARITSADNVNTTERENARRLASENEATARNRLIQLDSEARAAATIASNNEEAADAAERRAEGLRRSLESGVAISLKTAQDQAEDARRELERLENRLREVSAFGNRSPLFRETEAAVVAARVELERANNLVGTIQAAHDRADNLAADAGRAVAEAERLRTAADEARAAADARAEDAATARADLNAAINDLEEANRAAGRSAGELANTIEGNIELLLNNTHRQAEAIVETFDTLREELYAAGETSRAEELDKKEEAEYIKLQQGRLQHFREMLEEQLITQEQFDDLEVKLREEKDRRISEIAERAAQARLEYQKKFTEALVDEIKKYTDAFTEMTNNLSTVWSNSINAELEEKLRINDAMVQSDEERAAKEKDIRKQAAQLQHKADLFAWRANVITASAEAAMGVMRAWSANAARPVLAGIMAGLAAAMGATKIAAVVSAKPQPPRFHDGGAITGRGEVPIIGLAGEAVITPRDFSQQRQVTAALAGLVGNNGGVTVEPNVTIINNAPNTRVREDFDPSGVKIFVEQIVNEGMASGKFDRGFAGKDMRDGGLRFST